MFKLIHLPNKQYKLLNFNLKGKKSLVWKDETQSSVKKMTEMEIKNLVPGGHHPNGPTYICRSVMTNIPGWVSAIVLL